MKTTEHILHIAKLKNNCPECYGTDGLEISFVQDEVENQFYSKTLKSVAETIYCHNCSNIIYPVSWSDDIERVYEYHQKQAVPKNTQVHLKPITYGIILFFLLALASLIYYFGN